MEPELPELPDFFCFSVFFCMAKLTIFFKDPRWTSASQREDFLPAHDLISPFKFWAHHIFMLWAYIGTNFQWALAGKGFNFGEMTIEYWLLFLICRIVFYQNTQSFLIKKSFFSYFSPNFWFFTRLRGLFSENSDDCEGVPQAKALKHTERLRACTHARVIAGSNNEVVPSGVITWLDIFK